MGRDLIQYARELEKAIEDYCDSCLNNDGLCKPLSDSNSCSQIAPIKAQVTDIVQTCALDRKDEPQAS